MDPALGKAVGNLEEQAQSDYQLLFLGYGQMRHRRARFTASQASAAHA